MSKRFFCSCLCYVGSNFCGWQRQPESQSTLSVQQLFEEALEKVFQNKITCVASGRTDAGVHARRQIVHFNAETNLPNETILKAVNTYLPKDIRVLKIVEREKSFHAQRSATAKTYRYFILHSPNNHSSLSWPYLKKFTWFVPGHLDIFSMQEALKHMEGTHDFRAFQNTGTKLQSTVREIFSAQLIQHSNLQDFPWMPPAELKMQLLEIQIRGSGFLKQMVRAIAGTIVEVGRGKRKAEEMRGLLTKKDRSLSGITAPPYGLFLENVEYKENPLSADNDMSARQPSPRELDP